MKRTRISLVGFLLSFAALRVPPAEAHPSVPADPALPTLEGPAIDGQDLKEQTVEARLNKLTAAIREREQQLQADPLHADELIAKGFLDGDDRGWRRSRHSGWVDGRHGNDFRNSDPWRDGWRDGHRFFDWPND